MDRTHIFVSTCQSACFFWFFLFFFFNSSQINPYPCLRTLPSFVEAPRDSCLCRWFYFFGFVVMFFPAFLFLYLGQFSHFFAYIELDLIDFIPSVSARSTARPKDISS